MTDTNDNYKNNVYKSAYYKSAYKQGIEDMKEIILTIEQMYDNSNDDNDNDLLAELFGCSHDNYRMIFENFTLSEIQDKIKQYKQLTEVPIQIGDVVKLRKADNPINLLVIAIGNSYNPHLAYCNVMDSKGKVYRPMQLFNFCKTGKHIDISNIRKELENIPQDK